MNICGSWAILSSHLEVVASLALFYTLRDARDAGACTPYPVGTLQLRSFFLAACAFFLFFSSSYFTSMCNPLSYDRPSSVFYIDMPAWLLPLILPFLRCLTALSLRPLGFTLLNPNLNYDLIIQLIFPFLVSSLLPLQLSLCSSFPTPNFRAFQNFNIFFPP